MSPQSGSTILSTRVIFDWLGARAHAEISRQRDFTTSRSLLATDRDKTAIELDPGIWFWRVVDPEHDEVSKTWPLRVVDQVSGPLRQGVLQGSDINGDMLADVFVTAGVVTGRTTVEPSLEARPARILGARPKPLQPAPQEPPLQWTTPLGIGDVNGDGYQDAVVVVARRASYPDERGPVTMLLPGAALSGHWSATTLLPFVLQPLGDVDGDGYADVVACSPLACEVYTGSASGLPDNSTYRLPAYDKVLGVALDDDRYVDVIGIAKNRVAFHKGGPLGPSPTPIRTETLPVTTSSTVYLTEATGDGFQDLLGLGTAGSDTKLWLLSGTSDMSEQHSVTLFQWPKVGGLELDLRAVLQRTKQRPTLLLALKENASGFDQFGLSLPKGVQPLLVEPPVSRLQEVASDSTEVIGDFNGDGHDDLLLTSMQDIDGTLEYRLYLGSDRTFDPKHGSAELRSAEED